MSMYAIQDTTLTALGDAVRSKAVKYISVADIGDSELIYSITVDMAQVNWGGSNNDLNYQYDLDFRTLLGDKYNFTSKFYYEFEYETNNEKSFSVYIRDNRSSDTMFMGRYMDPSTEGYMAYNKTCTYRLQLNARQSRLDAGDTLTFTLRLWPCDENNMFIGLNKYTPLEMVDAIDGINTNPTFLLLKIISRAGTPFYSITKEDFGDITKIGLYALAHTSGLNSIELPDTLQEIEEAGCSATSITEITLPASLNKLGNLCFSDCGLLHTVRILNDTSVISCSTLAYSDPFYNCSKLASIYIPSKLYNAYCSDNYWSKHEDKFIPVGEWAFDPMINSILLFNQTKEVSIQLTSFANTPEFSITSSNEEVATISNVSINEDNTLITYTINSFAVEGSSTITVNIIGENNTYNFINNTRVFETIPEPTYEVVAVDGATYGFALREDGYWESQNFKQGNSGAICQVNISNPLNMPVYFDCINYAEANYDYGSLGAVNQVLKKDSSDDSGVKKNFKGLSKADIQTVEYLDASGDCFIQVKFRKDSSGDQKNDSIRFKVRFGEL